MMRDELIPTEEPREPQVARAWPDFSKPVLRSLWMKNYILDWPK